MDATCQVRPTSCGHVGWQPPVNGLRHVCRGSSHKGPSTASHSTLCPLRKEGVVQERGMARNCAGLTFQSWPILPSPMLHLLSIMRVYAALPPTSFTPANPSRHPQLQFPTHLRLEADVQQTEPSAGYAHLLKLLGDLHRGHREGRGVKGGRRERGGGG